MYIRRNYIYTFNSYIQKYFTIIFIKTRGTRFLYLCLKIDISSKKNQNKVNVREHCSG